MQEPHRKGLASHPGPESCVGRREVTGEALTGENTGPVLSCEIRTSRAPTPSARAEGHVESGAMRESLPSPAQSETRSMCGHSLRGTRESPQVPAHDGGAGRSGKVSDRTPGMHACGQSDGCVVPKKPLNKDGDDLSAEAVEGRQSTKGNMLQTATPRTQSRPRVSIGLERVRETDRPFLRQVPEVGAV